MNGLTDLSFIQKSSSTRGWQANQKEYQPVGNLKRTTNFFDADQSLGSEPTTSTLKSQNTFEPPLVDIWSPVIADTTPLQIWQGTVLSVNSEDKLMSVLLDAKMGQVPRHTADIGFEWVSEQDMDLVRPGAVFYLTLYKRTKLGGSIENSQELRFRRRPSWSLLELEHIERNASTFLSKMTALPTAE